MHSHAVLSNGINATANGMKSNVNNSPERTLPSKDVNENSIDDAYVKFIMYCNPSIPANVDTTELRKGFRAPPKSDGKSFSTFTLFGLISRLDSLKSWSSLVLELGVEQPDPTKNQSSQKVQQYAVRLKVSTPFFFLFLHSVPPFSRIYGNTDMCFIALAESFPC